MGEMYTAGIAAVWWSALQLHDVRWEWLIVSPTFPGAM